jgi:hypothetical protein
VRCSTCVCVCVCVCHQHAVTKSYAACAARFTHTHTHTAHTAHPACRFKDSASSAQHALAHVHAAPALPHAGSSRRTRPRAPRLPSRRCRSTRAWRLSAWPCCDASWLTTWQQRTWVECCLHAATAAVVAVRCERWPGGQRHMRMHSAAQHSPALFAAARCCCGTKHTAAEPAHAVRLMQAPQACIHVLKRSINQRQPRQTLTERLDTAPCVHIMPTMPLPTARAAASARCCRSCAHEAVPPAAT